MADEQVSNNGVQTPPQTGNPAESSPAAPDNSPASPASNGGTPSSPAATPDWRNSPEFRGIRKENQRYKTELEKLSAQNKELMARFEGFTSAQRGQQTESPEQMAQLEVLFDMMSRHPKFAEKFGLSKLSELEKTVGNLNESWNGSQYESEMDKVLTEAKGLGLDPEEVKEELQGLIDNDPVYSQIGYKPGALRAMYRNHYFERVGEFRERALNQERIKKEEALKRGQVQHTGGGSRPDGSKNADQKFGSAYKEGIDFAR